MYMESFDDSAFDEEEVFIELEEMNNIYDESAVSDLINRGQAAYKKSLTKWAKYKDSDAKRYFDKYDKADKEYDDYTKDGFKYDKMAHVKARDNYNLFRASSNADLQNKRRMMEDEYKSAMRRATTPEEKESAKHGKRLFQDQIARDEENYNRRADQLDQMSPKRGWKQKQLTDYQNTSASLQNKRQAAKADYRNAADKWANNKLHVQKSHAGKSTPGNINQFDRKMIKKGYLTQQREQEENRGRQMVQNARANGYFDDINDRKSYLKAQMAAKGKLPESMKGFTV